MKIFAFTVDVFKVSKFIIVQLKGSIDEKLPNVLSAGRRSQEGDLGNCRGHLQDNDGETESETTGTERDH